MSDIPSEVCEEILSRLPVEPLRRFRTVCKSWRSIIDDPDFPKLQLNHRKIEQEGDTMLTISSTNTGNLYSISLSYLNSCLTSSKTRRTQKINLTADTNFVSSCALNLPVPSCHGLILVPNFGVDNVWALCNICTGEFMFALPSRHDFVLKRWCSYGLGYDRSNDDYRVVRISSETIYQNTNIVSVIKSWIYSVKLRDWHTIEDFDLPGYNAVELSNHGVLCNGALHWFGSAWNPCIIALDLTTETYSRIPLAPIGDDDHPTRKSLDALDGCLALSYSFMKSFSVWILQDYGGGNRWVKLVSLAVRQLPFIDYRWNLRAVAYLRTEKQVVIRCKNKNLIWYDVENQECTKKVTIMGDDGGPFSYQVFPASVVKRADDRLQLKLRIPGFWESWYE